MSRKTVPGVIGIFLFLSVFTVGVLAQSAVPHQFYGSVGVNNNAAPDGTSVVAKIQGVDVGATKTVNGAYGKGSSTFKVYDGDNNRAGKTVEFYVDGIKAGQATFTNGESTQVDLSITKSTPNNNNNQGSGSSGGGGSGGSGGGFTGNAILNDPSSSSNCEEAWDCTDWLDCRAGKQERLCVDKNQCGTENNKPSESRECTKQETECVEDWSCGEWGPQVAGIQSRICNDLNACGTAHNKPQDVRNVENIDADVGLTGRLIGSTVAYSPFIIGALIVIVGALLFVRKKGVLKTKPQGTQ